METVLVWVLVISSWNSTRNMVEMLGPFADPDTCKTVQVSEPIKDFNSKCIQVKLVKGVYR